MLELSHFDTSDVFVWLVLLLLFTAGMFVVRFVRFGIYLSLFVMPLVAHVPASITEMVPFLGYFVLTVMLFVAWFVRRAWRYLQFHKNIPLDAVGKWILLFLLATLLSAPIAIYYNSELGLWKALQLYLRGAAPFSFLALYFLFLWAARNSVQTKRLYFVLMMSLLVVCVRGLWTYSSVGNGGRLTWYAWEFVMPYSVVGSIGSLAMVICGRGTLSRLWWGFACTVFLYTTAITYTRGLLLGLLVGVGVLALMVVRSQTVFRTVRLCLIVGIVGIGLVFVMHYTSLEIPLREGWEDAFGRSHNIQSRLLEIRESWQHFLEAPVFGKGLGFMRFTQRDYSLVGYVHNSFFYFLMTMGVIGVLLYHGLFFQWFRTVWDNIDRIDKNLQPVVAGSFAAVAAMVSYGFIFAAFRLFQFNELLAILMALAIACVTQKRKTGLEGTSRRESILTGAPGHSGFERRQARIRRETVGVE